MNPKFKYFNWKSSDAYITVLCFSLLSANAFAGNLRLQNLEPGQQLRHEDRMKLCKEASEVRAKFLSGEIHKITTQCSTENELRNVSVNDKDRIFSIMHRKNYENNISRKLIEELRSKQIEEFGVPSIQSHNLPNGLTGEVWQYGWGETCYLDKKKNRIYAGKSSGACLIIDTDLTASKKLLVEIRALIDKSMDPGYVGSGKLEVELYSRQKGARILDFSGLDKLKNADKPESKKPALSTAPKPMPAEKVAEVRKSEISCKDLYEQIKSEATGDTANCEKPWPEVDVSQCKAPPALVSSSHPTSHIALVLDASGSMAAKIGGQSKMSIAKKEIIDFISALEGDVPVGLVVYGHRGDNTKRGKAESCGSIEWALPVGSKHSDVESTIRKIQPTGWTPLASTLEYLESQLATLVAADKNKIASPVVYVVSDGKETCDGDPVAAARSLNASGVRATINVVGFDVDEKTRTQLEAISKAGGGQYFPARDSSALRKQLRAAQENEAAIARYDYCINLNIGKAHFAFHNLQIEATGCFHRETKTKWRDVIAKRIQEFDTEQEKSCETEVKSLAYTEQIEIESWIVKKMNTNLKMRQKAVEKAYEDSIFKSTATE